MQIQNHEENLPQGSLIFPENRMFVASPNGEVYPAIFRLKSYRALKIRLNKEQNQNQHEKLNQMNLNLDQFLVLPVKIIRL